MGAVNDLDAYEYSTVLHLISMHVLSARALVSASFATDVAFMQTAGSLCSRRC